MDVLPEKRSYEPGETARFQVRMPFRYATALVAVEREGIVSTQVMQLNGQNPTVELKVQPDWGPDRKSTRLNSSHLVISYAVFCLKKKHTGLQNALAPEGGLHIFPLHGFPLYNEYDDGQFAPELVRALRSGIDTTDALIMIST